MLRKILPFDPEGKDFATAIENVPALIVIAGPDGRIIHFNRACETLTGYDRREVTGKNLLDLFVPEEWKPKVIARFADIHSAELALPHENPWITKNGEQVMIKWRCAPMPDANGGTNIVGVGLDSSTDKVLR